MIEWINGLALQWSDWMVQMAWQAGLLAAGVALLDRLLHRKVWPQLRLMLWMAVLIKLLLPPTWSSPLGIPSPQVLFSNTPAQSRAASWPAGSPAEEVPTSFHAALVPANPVLSPRTWAMMVWLTGIGVLSRVWTARARRARRDLAEDAGRFRVPGWLREEADAAAASLGMRRVPQLWLCSRLATPAALGLLRPVVLLPARALDQMQRQDWRHVLLHEMAHIRRGDLWLDAACRILLTIYWFHPLLYLVPRRLGQLRELCCDSLASSRSPAGARAYRRTLLLFARRLAEPGAKSGPMLGLVDRPAGILARLDWLKRSRSYSGPAQCLAAAAVLAIAVLAAPMAQPAVDLPGAASDSGSSVGPEVGPNAADDAPADADEDPVAAQALENLRQAALGNNPGCLRLKYSALYLSLRNPRAAPTQTPADGSP